MAMWESRLRNSVEVIAHEREFFDRFDLGLAVVDDDVMRRLHEFDVLTRFAGDKEGLSLFACHISIPTAEAVFRAPTGRRTIDNLQILRFAALGQIAAAAERKYTVLCAGLQVLIAEGVPALEKQVADVKWRPDLDATTQALNERWSTLVVKFADHVDVSVHRENLEETARRFIVSARASISQVAEKEEKHTDVNGQQSPEATIEVAQYLCVMYALSRNLASATVRRLARAHVSWALKTFLISHPTIEDELEKRGHIGSMVITEMPEFKEARARRLHECMVQESWSATLDRIAAENRLAKEELDRLGSAYARFEAVYEASVVNDSVEAIAQRAKSFVDAHDGEATRQRFPDLVAAVCALWTSLTARTFKDKAVQRPHAVQVFAILRLLGVDAPHEEGKEANDAAEGAGGYAADDICRRVARHLAQVNTGEGKSLVLAVTASVFALCGNEVDCACYSSYLSQRDGHAFHVLFYKLGIHNRVHYATISDLCEGIIAATRDTRQAGLALLQKLRKAGGAQLGDRHARPRILLVDEVDVFCGPSFVGARLNPSCQIASRDIDLLWNRVWTLHSAGLLDTDADRTNFVEDSDEVANACDRCPSKFVHESVYRGLRALQKLPRHTYKVADGKIVYPSLDGSLSATTNFGYLTMWAGFQERDKGVVVTAPAYLQVMCGSFDFTEIPRDYALILGASGTLMNLDKQTDYLLQRYNINKRTIMPTIFAQKKQVFFPDRDVRALDSALAWADAIAREIAWARSSDRPVLVYFESESSLQSFSTLEPRVSSSAKLLTLGCRVNSFLELKSEACILALRQFGRGVDFVCPDPDVEARGGCHVILTFFPSTLAEQVQIAGRTARQNKSGSMKMILNVEAHAQREALLKAESPYALLNPARQGAPVAAGLAESQRRHQQTRAFFDDYTKWARGDNAAYDSALQFLVDLQSKN